MQDSSATQFVALLKDRGIQRATRDGWLQINAPAGAVDADLRAELGRRKAELVELLQRGAAGAALLPLVSMERPARIPQTQAQQGMWLIDHFTPGNVAYNIPEAFFTEGPIVVGTLQKAVDDLLARQAALRTCFYEEDGELLQSVSADARATLEFTDLSDRENSREILRTLIREQGRRPFTLDRAPLVRFHLFRMPGEQYAIFYNIHHIVADRQSLRILKQELIALYVAAARNEPAALPVLPIQYADYAIWGARHLENGAWTGQIAYWKRKLGDAPPFLQLPLSRAYPQQRTAWGATVPVRIEAPLRDTLSGIARQEGATMFMALLAAFSVLLQKLSGESDFCVGSPFTHRNQVETEGLIGLFVNMLVFRCQLGGERSFREVMQQARETALEAYENSDIPFQELVRALKPDPRSLRSPLFQVMFGFDAEERGGPAGLVQMDTDPGTARFDLTLQLGESSEGIFGFFEYCTDLFEEAAVAQMSRQFVDLLGQLAGAPDLPISTFQLVAAAAPQPKREDAPVTEKREAGFWGGKIKRLGWRSNRSESK